MESNYSPEDPNREETSDIPGLPSGIHIVEQLNTSQIHLLFLLLLLLIITAVSVHPQKSAPSCTSSMHQVYFKLASLSVVSCWGLFLPLQQIAKAEIHPRNNM